MANPNPSRVCRLHELVIRDAAGYSRAFRYGEVVEMTPWLAEALGAHLHAFEPIDVSPSTPIQDVPDVHTKE